VITCTPYLDNVAKKYNTNTTDISSTINTDTYIPVNSYQNNHCLVLGWSGSHSTVQYLYLLKDVLIALRKQIEFKLLVVGDENFKIDGIETEAHNWTEAAEVPLLQRIDIGLYPLPLNEEWVLGKSGLKALQYMALGIPTIATNVGCNDRVIENNISGYLVNNNEQWLEKLHELMINPGLRKRIGLNARNRVEQKFSIKANAAKYLNIINSVLS
jgi:glycosyltransferase involved in cell wall biosynthesis